MDTFLLNLILAGSLALAGCSDKKPAEQAQASAPAKEAVMAKPETPTPAANVVVPVDELTPPTAAEVGSPDEVGVIDTDMGRIVLEFFPDVAPVHVANFKKLARAGFYDGTTFHRVVPGFVIQGGDPNSKDDNPRNDGMGGPPWRVKAEFNDKLHVKGILSMARSQDFNSAGSQFFVCLGRAKNLDNEYTVFGNVISGIETVDDIGKTARDPQRNPDQPAVTMKSVRIMKRSEAGL